MTRASSLAAQPLQATLAYSAPEQCPNSDAFWSALTSRTRRVTPAELGRSQVLLRVVLQQRGQRILGRLEIIRNNLATEPRYVEAEACTDVLHALALTAALSLDPDALTRPPPPEPEEEEQDVEEPLPPVTFPELPVDAPDAPPSIPINWTSAIGFQLVGAMPVDPLPSWGASGALYFRGERAADLSPTLAIGAAALRSDLFGSDSDTRFTLYVLSAQACPVRGRVGRFEIRPCIGTLLGLLDASGQNISDPESSERIWVSVGGALDFEYALTNSLALQLSIAGHAPVLPQRYLLGKPAEETARTPVFLPWVGLGLGHAL